MKFLKAHAPSRRVSISFTDSVQKAAQEFKEDVNINSIVAKFKKSGLLGDPERLKMARYGDLTQVPDYAEMMNRVIAAREAFLSLPPELRAKYDNDPGKLIKGLQSKEGQELAVKLGLAVKREPEAANDEIQPIKNPPTDDSPNSSPKAKKASKAVAEE